MRQHLAPLLPALVLGCATPAAIPGADSVAPRPAPRWGHTLVWDPLSEELLLFGGASERGAYLADTWTWDGARWQRHTVAGPPARGFAGAAFHAGRGTIVLHGGRAEGRRPHADTWEWDGAQWSPIETSAAPAVDHFGLVYHPARDELLAFGGWNGSGVSGETWLFDGDWRRVARDGPPPRSAFGMAHDAARDRTWVYGGLWIQGQYADLWTWSDGRWQAAAGPYDNSSLDHHALVFDEARGQVLGFGGKDYRYRMQDTTFALADGRVEWLAGEGPSPRHSTPLAWDGARVLLFGGKEYAGEEQLPLGDLWAWDGARWTRLEE